MNALALVLAISTAGWAQAPEKPQESPSFPLWELGTMPQAMPEFALVQMQSVQELLKLTKGQTARVEAHLREMQQKFRKALGGTRDRQKIMEARAVAFTEAQAAMQEILAPSQRDLLRRLALQVAGPFAFSADENRAPMLAEPLKLTDDQVKKLTAIVQSSLTELEEAAKVPIPIKPEDTPTAESIKTLVASPEFRAAVDATRQRVAKARAVVMERIRKELTPDQIATYDKMLGAPIDLQKLEPVNPDMMASQVARGLGLGGGQRADPNFNTKVENPAYTSTHPRVLFDEAHNNFHTATGRYKPFADLMTSDGYVITPNKQPLSKKVLQDFDILIIANPMVADADERPDSNASAFTDAECDAVRDWVRAGGGFLLITDHPPFGSSADRLARRFGVEMSKGVATDPANDDPKGGGLAFSRDRKQIGDHAITRGRNASERINRVLTFTGQSLKGPEGSTPILIFSDTAIDRGMEDDRQSSAAGRSQGLALKFGKGRVVVMGEAAELSAQIFGLGGESERMGMNVPGCDNRQMALNIMHWLSGLMD